MFTTIETKDGDIRIVHTTSIVDVYLANTASRAKTSVSFLHPGVDTGVEALHDIADLKQHRDLAEALAFARSRMLALRAAEEGQAKP
jgi:hypothetical protein